VEIVLALLGAVVGALVTVALAAYRERPRLKLSIGAATAIGQRPAAWIEVQNTGGRATTVREVGFCAKGVRFQKNSSIPPAEARERAPDDGVTPSTHRCCPTVTSASF
jgi:hypothetical protein